MQHVWHSATMEAAHKAVTAALDEARAPRVPFSALNALHRALVAIESADTDLREAQDNSQGGDFSA